MICFVCPFISSLWIDLEEEEEKQEEVETNETQVFYKYSDSPGRRQRSQFPQQDLKSILIREVKLLIHRFKIFQELEAKS